MENQKINWFELSDAQRVIVLNQARSYLQQQVAESKLSESILRKHELLE